MEIPTLKNIEQREKQILKEMEGLVDPKVMEMARKNKTTWRKFLYKGELLVNLEKVLRKIEARPDK